ncbi:MAG: NUDIX hydrolase [Lachnospiraceae bacterium]|nr:NUDIX hydrolase [Lachnospiraceae bacterium]
MEIWDAYDESFQLISDITLVRGEAIPDGIYHLVCDIIVRHTDGTYLLMQRDYRKPYGGMWEASAGGSALRGESSRECAVRELKEETGIISDDLHELGRVVHHSHQSIYAEYLCVTDQSKDSIILQDGETQAYKWVDRDELINMRKTELVTDRIQIFLEELQR